MTHFDFKTLLPALLQVEDRVSMAHGVESRVPLLDHPLVELAATIPADIKFKNGQLKHIMRVAFGASVPACDSGPHRQDGISHAAERVHAGPGARLSCRDVFSSAAARGRDVINNTRVLDKLDDEPQFGRKLWGLLSLELWQQEFHDRSAAYRALLHDGTIRASGNVIGTSAT